MYRQLWNSQATIALLVTASITFVGCASSKKAEQATEENVVAADSSSNSKSFNDLPVMKFSSPKSAPLVNDKMNASREVMKFAVGYDEQKLVADIESEKQEMKRESRATSDTVYPSHKFVFSPNSNNYSGTFDYTGTVALSAAQKAQTFASNTYGLDLSYFYSPSEDYIFETYLGYQTASTSRLTQTVTTRTIAISDTQVSTTPLSLRGNYCWTVYGSRLCPGVEFNYDSYAVLATTNTSTTRVSGEMMSAVELSSGINVYHEMPFFDSFAYRLRLGYTMGTGVGRSGVSGSQNAVTYGVLDFDWAFLKGHSATLGTSYLTRKVVLDSGNVATKATSVSLGYIYEL